MDLSQFLQRLAQGTAWVIRHGPLLSGILVALIIALFLFGRGRSD